MNKKTRVLIVDDSHSFRMGLRALLSIQPDLEVVGEAPDGEAAMESIGRLNPTLVLLDAQMPGMTGIEATRQVKSRWPQVKVIALSMYHDYQEDALAAGADTFMSKDESPENVLDRISQLLCGRSPT